MNSLDLIKKTGEWWINPWWKKEGLNLYCPHSISEVDESAGILKKHFDATWAKKLANKAQFNEIFPALCIGGSTSHLILIVSLGRTIKLLEESTGIERIISALKGTKSDSALLELNTAHIFSKSGWFVEFPHEGKDKSPDIIAKLDENKIAIECKSLKGELWEDVEYEIMDQLATRLPTEKNGKEIIMQTSLNSRLTQAFLPKKDEPYIYDASVKAVVNTIVTAAISALEDHKIPFKVGIGEFAEVSVSSPEDGEYSGIYGIERTSSQLTRRIFQNALLRALPQIPEKTPGAIVAHTKVLPDPTFFNVFFDAMCNSDNGRFGHLMAIILIPLQTIFNPSPSLVFLNRHSNFLETQAILTEIFTTHFNSHVVGDTQ